MYLRRRRRLSWIRILFLTFGLLTCSVYQFSIGNFQLSAPRRAQDGEGIGGGFGQDYLSIWSRKLLQTNPTITAQTSPRRTPRTSTPTTGVPKTRNPTTGIPKASTPTTGVSKTSTPTTGVPKTRTPTTGVPKARTPTIIPNTTTITRITSTAEISKPAVSEKPRLRGCILVGNEIIPAPTTPAPIPDPSIEPIPIPSLEPPLGHTKGEYPADLFSVEERRQGWVILHIAGMIYMFIALALVCDEYFVPSLGTIIEKLKISGDVAGATFMAAGGSAPELFTSLIGVFISHSNVGIGTIVGSAVFNILFVIGMCAVFSREILHLTWWPLFRDVSFYILDLIMLIVFFLDNVIVWWESVLLLSGYISYVSFMKFNGEIERWFKENIVNNSNVVKVISMIDMGKPKVLLTRGCSTASLHNSTQRNTIFQLMISTLDPLTEVKFKEKAEIMSRMAKGQGKSKDQQGNKVKGGAVNEKTDFPNCVNVKVTPPTDPPITSPETADAEEQAKPTEAQKADTKDDGDRKDDGETDGGDGKDGGETDGGDGKDGGETDGGETDGGDGKDGGETDGGDGKDGGETDGGDGKDGGETDGGDGKDGGETDGGDGKDGGETDGGDGKDGGETDGGDGKDGGETDGGDGKDGGDGGSDGSDDDEDDDSDDSDEDSDIDEDEKEEANDDDDEPLSLEWPETRQKQVTYLCLLPIVIPLWLTVPDVRNRASKKYFIGTFLGSIMWIGAFSYLMVWWAHQVGETIGISEEIMGLTILAAGTSIPDLITSVIVARKGLGDMAVSSSVGSNIFDITVGLPVPWLLYATFNNFTPVPVSSNGLFCAIVLLFLMLLFVIISIGLSKWKMNKVLGFTMFCLYFAFLIISVMLEDRIIVCPVSI
ncbi:sodium/potassium/calcium exchanger 1 [Heptranchias perlo]|uniref:sodium/potassium/calcium exchanger 1 n=1 Tax=Heptranchias perlo TaxID=212740 RepID=UPI00355979FD